MLPTTCGGGHGPGVWWQGCCTCRTTRPGARGTRPCQLLPRHMSPPLCGFMTDTPIHPHNPPPPPSSITLNQEAGAETDGREVSSLSCCSVVVLPHFEKTLSCFYFTRQAASTCTLRRVTAGLTAPVPGCCGALCCCVLMCLTCELPLPDLLLGCCSASLLFLELYT